MSVKDPACRLHRPRTALLRLQHLAGKARAVAGNDRDENRAAKLRSILTEAFDVALAARTGGPLPPARDHDREV